MTVKSLAAVAADLFRLLMIYRLSKSDSLFPRCSVDLNIVRSLYYMDELGLRYYEPSNLINPSSNSQEIY